jgi:hypothetical protein
MAQRPGGSLYPGEMIWRRRVLTEKRSVLSIGFQIFNREKTALCEYLKKHRCRMALTKNESITVWMVWVACIDP